MSVNPVTFVAPNLGWGEARGASARAPGASPASGAVTDEQNFTTKVLVDSIQIAAIFQLLNP